MPASQYKYKIVGYVKGRKALSFSGRYKTKKSAQFVVPQLKGKFGQSKINFRVVSTSKRRK